MRYFERLHFHARISADLISIVEKHRLTDGKFEGEKNELFSRIENYSREGSGRRSWEHEKSVDALSLLAGSFFGGCLGNFIYQNFTEHSHVENQGIFHVATLVGLGSILSSMAIIDFGTKIYRKFERNYIEKAKAEYLSRGREK